MTWPENKPSVWEGSGAVVLLTLLQRNPVDLIAIPPTPFNFHLDTAIGGAGVVLLLPAVSEMNKSPLGAFHWCIYSMLEMFKGVENSNNSGV